MKYFFTVYNDRFLNNIRLKITVKNVLKNDKNLKL